MNTRNSPPAGIRVDTHRITLLSNLPHCTGGCNGGRKPCDCATGCTELANTHAPLHIVRSAPTKRLPAPHIQAWHYPTPRRRLVKRFFRDLVAFLMASRWSR